MPYTSAFVPAEVFMEHNGVTIYHVYKNDDMNQGARWYLYATTDHGWDAENDQDGEFDVHDLPTWPEGGSDDLDVIRQVIAEAIDVGYFADFPTG